MNVVTGKINTNVIIAQTMLRFFSYIIPFINIKISNTFSIILLLKYGCIYQLKASKM